MDQVAGLADPVMLDIIQRTDPHGSVKKPAEVTLADMAAFREVADGDRLRIMLIDPGKSGPDAEGAVRRGRQRILTVLDCRVVQLRKKGKQHPACGILVKRLLPVKLLKDMIQVKGERG